MMQCGVRMVNGLVLIQAFSTLSKHSLRFTQLPRFTHTHRAFLYVSVFYLTCTHIREQVGVSILPKDT